MKKNIAIMAGGYSSEAEVSLRSAVGLYKAFDKTLFDVYVVVLTQNDWLVLCDSEELESNPTLSILQHSRIVPIDKNNFSFAISGKTICFDYAYITIHGTPGEDGRLQGYLDMLGIPYSNCGHLASALTFNKFTCNHYLANFGVKISPSMLLRKGETIDNEELISRIGLPCFIKSNVGGSSYGCTKVHNAEEIQPAIAAAFAEGDEVIMEQFMAGTEITSAAVRLQGKIITLPLTEVVSKNEFFDYDAKYNGQVSEITPARIPAEVTEKVQALTKKIYDLLDCKGIIRIDYILAKDWEIQLLEINTTPGMTETSFVPQEVRAAGLSMTDVLTQIVRESIEC